MPIRVLDPSVVWRIAAGEVVERPSSVAKELIENAIDAGATAVTIDIKNGGIDSLRVTDNGCGIAPSQVALAFENHATSKLKTAEQLDDIRTLGFRGEALPSIAAVSHVEMTTREKGAASGVRLKIDGGIKKPVEEAGCPEGTTVVVRDLFYNVPVRRTFLKKPNYEGALVNDLAARMILGNPGVSFRFINNGKQVYHSFGDGSLKHALFAVYGAETAEKSVMVDASCGGMRIFGSIGVGDLAKATRAHQCFYINGRTVRCGLLTQVLEQVCKGRVTIGAYPMCALTMTLPPTGVDVNVHPNKLEVRFRDEISVRLAAENILSQAFAGEKVLDFEKKPVPEVTRQVSVTREAPPPPPPEEAPPAPREIPVPRAKMELREGEAPLPLPEQPRKAPAVPESGLDQAVRRAEEARQQRQREALENHVVLPEKAEAVKAEQMAMEPPAEEGEKPVYRVIGTLLNTYILLEVGDSLMMIDQHAAHERLMYEKFTERMNRGEKAAQELLVPIVVDVSPREMALIQENREALEAAGYTAEPFGDRSVSLRSVPFILGKAEARPAFLEMLGNLDRLSAATRQALADEIAMMACKAAVKGGDRLSDSEIQALLMQMQQTGASPTCPHGRPVSRTLTRRDIEKLFKRIQ